MRLADPAMWSLFIESSELRKLEDIAGIVDI